MPLSTEKGGYLNLMLNIKQFKAIVQRILSHAVVALSIIVLLYHDCQASKKSVYPYDLCTKFSEVIHYTVKRKM